MAAAEQEVGEIGRVGAVRNNLTGRYLAVLGVALVTWWLIYGQLALMATPAVIVDGRIVMSGRVPTVGELKSDSVRDRKRQLNGSVPAPLR